MIAIDIDTKKSLVDLAWDVTERIKPKDVELKGACVYAAEVTKTVITQYLTMTGETDFACFIQAGTMQWPRLTEEQDDGRPETASHFSYVFEPLEALRHLMAGRMPEVHAWTVLVRKSNHTVDLIDITTRHLVTQAKSNGWDWPGDVPPDFFWCNVKTGDRLMDNWPDRVVYKAHPDATVMVKNMLTSSLRR